MKLAPLCILLTSVVTLVPLQAGCGSATRVPENVPPPEPGVTDFASDPDATQAKDSGADADEMNAVRPGPQRVTTCSMACSQLRAVQCRTGSSVDGGDSCATTCQHVLDTRLTPLDVQCAIRARTLSAAKACPGWGC